MKIDIKFYLLILGFLCVFSSCSDDEETCTELEWYADTDADGLGDPDVSILDCEQPDGYVENADDTDDDMDGDDTDGDDTDNDTDSDDTDDDGTTEDDVEADLTVIDVDADLFLEGTTVTTVSCTLSDGTVTTCYQIVASTPTDHDMGPWCPDNITDGAEAGGIWLEDGEVHDVDGEFIKNLATFYDDDTWLMYDEDGNIYKTLTEDDCINAANPDVGDEYENFCVECIPDYITDLTRTWLIPTTPVKLTTAASFAGMGPQSSGPTVRGIAFNGVEFSASAPVDNILSAYTIAPFDDAGGHINVNQGYHYHTATGLSTQVTQDDGHAEMIGYAADGHGIYEQLNEDDSEPDDLDACRGHYDETRGYHYHVDAPGSNNFIDCLYGAYPG